MILALSLCWHYICMSMASEMSKLNKQLKSHSQAIGEMV